MNQSQQIMFNLGEAKVTFKSGGNSRPGGRGSFASAVSGTWSVFLDGRDVGIISPGKVDGSSLMNLSPEIRRIQRGSLLDAWTFVPTDAESKRMGVVSMQSIAKLKSHLKRKL